MDVLTRTVQRQVARMLRKAHAVLERGHLLGPGTGGGPCLPTAVNAEGEMVACRSPHAVAWCAKGALVAATAEGDGEVGGLWNPTVHRAERVLYSLGLNPTLGIWNDHHAKPGEVELLFALAAEVTARGDAPAALAEW